MARSSTGDTEDRDEELAVYGVRAIGLKTDEDDGSRPPWRRPLDQHIAASNHRSVMPGLDPGIHSGRVPRIAGHRHWQRCPGPLAFACSENSKSHGGCAWRLRGQMHHGGCAARRRLPVADGVTRGAIARFRFLQSRVQPSPAEARRPYPLLCLPRREQQRIPARAAGARRERVDRGAVAQEFEMAAILVNRGDPATSRLLQQPLAPEVGGNVFHSAGGSSHPRTTRTGRSWRLGQRQKL